MPPTFHFFHTSPPAIHLISTLDSLHQLLPTSAPDLFLATWSLSETPLAFRRPFVPFLQKAARLLIAYQSTFADVDNAAYFAGVNLPHGRIRNTAIGHLPQNHYLSASS